MAKLKATSVAGDLTVTGKVTSTVAGATTSTIGTVKLNNATNSTSTTEAATAAAVKAAYDRAGHSHPYVPTATGGNIVIHADSDASSTAEYITIKAGHNELTVGSSAGGGTATKGNDKIKFNGNQVYHAGAKPSKSDVGLSNVNNWGASSDKAHNSTSTYATTNMVAQVRAEKANTSHGNHVPATQTANNAVYLRNDNTWQTITPDKIGAATSGHTHNQTFYADTRAVNYNPNTAPSEFRTTFQQNNTNGVIDGGSYYTLMHIPRYNHSSGGFGNQMAFTDNNNVFVRRGTSDTAWGSWYKIYHSGAKPTLSELGAAASNHGHNNATTSAHGFMSNTDKGKLDGIATGANKYTHPNDANTRHVTDTEKGNWNGAVTKANDWNSFKTNGGTIGGTINLSKDYVAISSKGKGGLSIESQGTGIIVGKGDANQHIVEPYSTFNGMISLGSTANTFKNVYLSDGVYLQGGSHIRRSNDSLIISCEQNGTGVCGFNMCKNFVLPHSGSTSFGSDVYRWKDIHLEGYETGRYTKLPNGMLLQFGRYYAGPGPSSDFRYPTAFAETAYSLVVTGAWGMTSNHYWVVGGNDRFSFSLVKNGNRDLEDYICWMAIGKAEV